VGKEGKWNVVVCWTPKGSLGGWSIWFRVPATLIFNRQ
jgi:hypothetical protein